MVAPAHGDGRWRGQAHRAHLWGSNAGTQMSSWQTARRVCRCVSIVQSTEMLGDTTLHDLSGRTLQCNP